MGFPCAWICLVVYRTGRGYGLETNEPNVLFCVHVAFSRLASLSVEARQRLVAFLENMAGTRTDERRGTLVTHTAGRARAKTAVFDIDCICSGPKRIAHPTPHPTPSLLRVPACGPMNSHRVSRALHFRQGIALVDKKDGDGKEKVSYVPASGLPFSPADRLAALFRIKSKWPMGELEPYIS